MDDPCNDSFLFNQGATRGLGKIQFHDIALAYDSLDLPNVNVFKEQIVAPYEQLEAYDAKDLADKTVLTSTVSPDRLAVLKDKGIRLVIDCSIQLFDQTVGLNC